jgi:hypothetical protein
VDGSLIVSGCTPGIGLSVGSDTTDNVGMEVCSSPYNGWFSAAVPRERLLTRLTRFREYSEIFGGMVLLAVLGLPLEALRASEMSVYVKLPRSRIQAVHSRWLTSHRAAYLELSDLLEVSGS